MSPMAFIIIMSILFAINTFSKTDFSDNVRKKQALEASKEDSGLVEKVKRYTDKKVQFKKRAAIEMLARQAGLGFGYAIYFILRIATCAGLFSISLLTRNVYLAVVLGVSGFFIPKIVITSLRNKRVDRLEKQIGPFLQMVTTRYLNSKDFEKSLKLTREEFKGMEPIYSELKLTTAEVESKVPVADAMDHMAERCENKFLSRFADYYRIASMIGTKEARENLLGQAYLQFEEERKLKALLKNEIQEPKRDAFIVMMSIPLFMLFGIFALEGYWDFITNEMIGKILVAGVALVLIILTWYINTKIAGPIK